MTRKPGDLCIRGKRTVIVLDVPNVSGCYVLDEGRRVYCDQSALTLL